MLWFTINVFIRCHSYLVQEITPSIQLSGPTSFAPLIRGTMLSTTYLRESAAIDIVRQAQAYHILVIIADGQVDNVRETSDAIVEATNYPLSIVTIGVGDGPWELMEEFGTYWFKI